MSLCFFFGILLRGVPLCDVVFFVVAARRILFVVVIRPYSGVYENLEILRVFTIYRVCPRSFSRQIVLGVLGLRPCACEV